MLHFNASLDPARAQDVANFRIVGPDGRRVAIASAAYDRAAHTVTLAPRGRLDLHKVYRLAVVGTGPRGIADAASNLLDGGRTGRPGSNYVVRVTAANLVLGARVPGGPRRLARLRRATGGDRRGTQLAGPRTQLVRGRRPRERDRPPPSPRERARGMPDMTTGGTHRVGRKATNGFGVFMIF